MPSPELPGGIAPTAQEHFHRLLAFPLDSPARLLEAVDRYVATVAAARLEFPDLNLPKAKVIAAKLHELLAYDEVRTSDLHQRWIQAAARYFFLGDDAVPDWQFWDGFDDDLAVVNAVANAVGASFASVSGSDFDAANRSFLATVPSVPTLKCPRDQQTLKQDNWLRVTVDMCPDCHGLWLDVNELSLLVGTWIDLPSAEIAEKGEFLMCPRGCSFLSTYYYSDQKKVVVDRCPVCAGVWLDSEELKQIIGEVLEKQ